MAIFTIGVCFSSYNFFHESIHEQIYLHDGCSNVTIKSTAFEGSAFCEDGDYHRSNEAWNQQMINEIVSYNLTAVVFILSAVIIFAVILNFMLWTIKEKLERKE
jgi:hypothetical protein